MDYFLGPPCKSSRMALGLLVGGR